MIKKLTKKEYTTYHYKDGVKIEGVHKDIYGDASDIYGNVSHIYGDVSGIRGNLDDCEIKVLT